MPSRSKSTQAVRLAIVGTGGMANHHAKMFAADPHCKIVAACDVDSARVEKFTADHGIAGCYTDLKKMLKTEQIDAVSVVTSDAFHMPVSLTCIKAGKHVLCEKPLALNAKDARKMAAAAKRAGIIHMVNFSYRDWPCLHGAADAIRKGQLGELRHVEASYLQAWLVSKAWDDWRTSQWLLWRLSTAHGSKGALGDIGVHIIDYAMLPAGPITEVYCKLKTFPKAKNERIGEYHFDANDSAILQVEFANGALGVIHTTRWAPGHENRLALKISGTLGSIELDSDLSDRKFRICAGEDVHTSHWREVECETIPGNYARFLAAIRKKQPVDPDFARGAQVQRVLDAAFDSHLTGRAVKI